MTAPGTVIRAAGGVLWRPGADGPVEVALVHRPRYDDWSLPKGKLDGHEPALLAAVREVAEETGRAVVVGHRLRTVRYDVKQRHKAVRYWAVRDAGPMGDGRITDADEVDRLCWLSLEQAAGRLSYADDREVLDAFAATPVTTATVLLVRHARAGKRADWDGPDDRRPLDDRGRAQAAALATVLQPFAPTAVYAADRVRCRQTVQPLADALGTSVTTVPELSDEAFQRDPAATRQTVQRLAGAGATVVVCSQGSAIPGLLADWVPADVRAHCATLETRKAAWWAIGVDRDEPVWLDHYDRPA